MDVLGLKRPFQNAISPFHFEMMPPKGRKIGIWNTVPPAWEGRSIHAETHFLRSRSESVNIAKALSPLGGLTLF